MVDTVDTRRTSGDVHVLPDAEAVVDERVVHVEDRVAGAGRDISHHTADTVVSKGVGSGHIVSIYLWARLSLHGSMDSPSFGAALHVGIRGSRVASVDEVRVALCRQACGSGTRQAMGGVAHARANVGSEPSKGTRGDTDRVAIRVGAGQPAKVQVAEEIQRGKVASVLGLIPPRERRGEAALVTQDLLKRPEEVTVPHEELGVAVDVGHVQLVQPCQVLEAVRRRSEVARRWLLDQADDGVHEVRPVGQREVTPFVPHVRVGSACRRLCCLHRGDN